MLRHLALPRESIENNGKISAKPHPTLCIQFLNRENNDKNNTFPSGKQICFTTVWGCAETLPNKACDKKVSSFRSQCTDTFVLCKVVV